MGKAENAFKEGDMWGGRQKNNEFYLGLECTTSQKVEIKMIQGCGHSADAVTIQKKVAGEWLDVGSSGDIECVDDQEVTIFPPPPDTVEGWRIKAETTKTKSGWAWDVKRLKFIVDGAELEVGPCQAVDSGSANSDYKAENAFKEGDMWGGRQKNNEF